MAKFDFVTMRIRSRVNGGLNCVLWRWLPLMDLSFISFEVSGRSRYDNSIDNLE